jgi:hypothetical protein
MKNPSPFSVAKDSTKKRTAIEVPMLTLREVRIFGRHAGKIV